MKLSKVEGAIIFNIIMIQFKYVKSIIIILLFQF